MKQMEVYRSHSKFMKNKVEQLKEELTTKESQAEDLRRRASALQSELVWRKAPRCLSAGFTHTSESTILSGGLRCR
ncbi:unnamed protein product [Ranitomeya imitator]|uniref:Uncharacterized protein n=1 Tax=Ranitomeya imitator TaxID=111125 RepID=A0ABN9KMD6_9NEOB|nr:unnamed protein product [Ranitomeya imitator]